MRAHIALLLILSACGKPASRNRVVDVLATDAPTVVCVPQPSVGGLDVALCREPVTLKDGGTRIITSLCTGGGLVPVSCTTAFRREAPAQPPAPQPTPTP